MKTKAIIIDGVLISDMSTPEKLDQLSQISEVIKLGLKEEDLPVYVEDRYLKGIHPHFQEELRETVVKAKTKTRELYKEQAFAQFRGLIDSLKDL